MTLEQIVNNIRSNKIEMRVPQMRAKTSPPFARIGAQPVFRLVGREGKGCVVAKLMVLAPKRTGALGQHPARLSLPL